MKVPVIHIYGFRSPETKIKRKFLQTTRHDPEGGTLENGSEKKVGTPGARLIPMPRFALAPPRDPLKAPLARG